MTKLHISDNLSLPLDAITDKRIIVGGSGAGKSTTAVDLAEEILKNGQQLVVIDPKDDWWGIRSRADGKTEGYPITILGGKHADAPLEHTAGKIVGEWIVKEHVSLILSIKHFSDTQRYRFIYDLMDYLVKNCEDPLALIVDEADQVAPQEKNVRIEKGAQISEAMMLGLVRRAVKQGRTGGLGITFVTQSPASFDKRVMNLCPVMIAHRTIGKQDFAQVRDWFSVWVSDQKQFDQAITLLPTLKTGQAIYYSPNDAIFEIVQMRQAETFDSRQTPKVGHKRVEPKVLAPAELKNLSEKMAETIERAKQDDPRELRRQLAELQRQLRDAKLNQAQTPSVEPTFQRVEVPILPEGALGKLEQLASMDDARIEQWQRLFAESKEQVSTINHAIEIRRQAQSEMRALIDSATKVNRLSALPTRPHTPAPMHHADPRPARNADLVDADAMRLNPGETKVLIAAAQYSEGVTMEQLAVLTKYRKTSRETYTKTLAARGLIVKNRNLIQITDAGLAALPANFEPLPTGIALQEYWLRELKGGEKKIFEVVLAAHPNAIDLQSIMDATGYKKTSVDTYLKELKARKLVTRESGRARASDELYGSVV